VVPVAYADWRSAHAPPPEEVLVLAAQLPGRLLLVDTFDKSGGTLLDHLPWELIEAFVSSASDSGVRLVLAGSLRLTDIERLVDLEPVYLGVRGAACIGGRAGAIDAARVKSLAAAVRGNAAPIAS
jgi:uncharacterized protein (UPF0264 family)